MSIVESILVMLIMLSLLVIVHEYGHFIVARLFKVRVNEFSIFMGPKLFQRTSKKTGMKFSIRALPIGGYCVMEDENGEDTKLGNVKDGSFFAKPKGVRALVFVAGPFMNILLGLVFSIVLFSISGFSTNVVSIIDKDHSLIAEYNNTVNEDEQITVGDKIISYDGKMVLNPTDYSLFRSMDDDLHSVIEFKKENGKVIEIDFDRTPDKEGEPVKVLGMAFERVESPNFFSIVWYSLKYLLTLVRTVLYSLLWIITGRVGMEAVAGPVGLTTVVSDVIELSGSITNTIINLLNMAALISENLGLFNLIPFPGLDGGQLVLVGVEAIRGKRLPAEKQGLISIIGLVILIGISVLVMGNDILRIINGG